MSKFIRWIFIIAAAGLGLFLLIQLVPVDRTNPPAGIQVQWDSQQTETLFRQACADCHSNETVWPWYARVAPVSWLVAHDVEEGRERFNISDLAGMRPRSLSDLPEEVAEVVYEGEMPMRIYVIMHPEARLNEVDQQTLVEGLQRTLQSTLAIH